ncbi:hypothetical protein NECAME_11244 [Necator americanus]|uniref:Uncharacterized protein n=1 Tax=Necator americanus TaxID=51031 RepID=W2T7I7_NECAM|nr:hypothetical protein NECAME_11244 [Necator americanus]ETN77131.1 hypothetical protein NECAME_11244 [Necator americanus]
MRKLRMSIASKSRFIFLISSSLLAVIAVAIIASCLFSVSFRYITDHEHLKGTRYYGLIRYCFESEFGSYGSDDSNADVCYLRTAAPKHATKIEYKTQYGEFELATLILLSCAIAASLLAYHFGWAYYWSGGAAACLFVSFVSSLFASACVLVHKQQKDKIDTVVL